MLTDRQRVEIGVVVTVLSDRMLPLREFCASPQGSLVADLLARTSREVLGTLSDRARNKLLRRTQRETGPLLQISKGEQRDSLQSFNAALAFSYEVFASGKLPIQKMVAARQLSAFVTGIVAPKGHDLSVLGESVNDRVIRETGQAMLGMAMSNGLYRY